MNKSFSWRVFTSFGLFWSLVMLLISGVILSIYPGGRGSGLIWEFGGLTKPGWQHQHIIFGFVFALFSLYHLFIINWKPFFTYLNKKATEGRHRHAELLTTIILTSFIAIGTSIGIQPFSGILNIGKTTPSLLEPREQKDKESPAPLAETTTIHERSDHHDIENDHHGIQESPLIAFEQEEKEESANAALNTSTNNTNMQTSNSQAPDDELHRRTKASCSSCH
jgi:hypothetical protein